jgi:hypothetical protein
MRGWLARKFPAVAQWKNLIGRLAQLVRAPRLHRGGPRFEPVTAHHPQPTYYKTAPSQSRL